MRTIFVLALFCVALFLSSTSAQPAEPAAAEIPAATPQAKATIHDLAWMAGTWEGAIPIGKTETHFSRPEAGLMMGSFRLYNATETMVLEFFSLREKEGGIEYCIRHFSPGMEAWEEKDRPIVTRLERMYFTDEAQYLFKNISNTQPKSIEIIRKSLNEMRSVSNIEQGDSKRKIEVTLTRAEPLHGNPLRDIQPERLWPVDESSQDPDFSKFWNEFKQAVADKNGDFIKQHLQPGVTSSFGGNGGIEEFIEWYEVDKPDAKLWGILNEIIPLGGTFKIYDGKRHFVAPYVSSRFKSLYDAFFYSAVIRPNAPLFQEPRSDSPVIDTLNYEIVKTLHQHRTPFMENGYQKVTTLDGQDGWVKPQDIRSPISYRIGLVQDQGEWKIQFLVAGD